MNYLNNKSEVSRDFELKLSQISPFELKNQLLALADESLRKDAHILLNAGRGNPNWVCTIPRDAFFLFGQFAMQECRRTWQFQHDIEQVSANIAGTPQQGGIAQRYEQFLREQEELLYAFEHEETENGERPSVPTLDSDTLSGWRNSVEFLQDIYNFMLMELTAEPDELIYEWAEAASGCQYPVPDRILKYTEIICQAYLDKVLCNNEPPEGTYDLFATEGGTAAMCYIFDSLMQNFLLHKGDTIGLLVPVFTPYIEIPELARYDFDVHYIPANRMSPEGLHEWQYDEKDLACLRDQKFKAVFIVNPSNPPSYALAPETIAVLKDTVDRWNPNLMIITDDVYGTFVTHFESLMAKVPHNTLCVYSFSKYFGATGWRLACIALHQDNIYDKLIAALPRKRKSELARRYGTLRGDVENMKFIDRMVADSRQVALNHTAGLSLPQQLQMSFFALFELLDEENAYQKEMIDLISHRLHNLWDNTGFKLLDDPLRAGYYAEIDMLVWARKFYGDDFVNYLKTTYNPINVVLRLATETSLVVLNGGGFEGPEWSVRVSLANLNDDAYTLIGKHINQILTEYAEEWKARQTKPD